MNFVAPVDEITKLLSELKVTRLNNEGDEKMRKRVDSAISVLQNKHTQLYTV